MIEQYLDNIHLEFPVYEAISKNDFVCYRRKGILKKMVEAASSYKKTPPCPSLIPKGKIILCGTSRVESILNAIKK